MNPVLQLCGITMEQSSIIAEQRNETREIRNKTRNKSGGKYSEFSLYRICKRDHIVTMALLIFLGGKATTQK
jgi:hypothetical protein